MGGLIQHLPDGALFDDFTANHKNDTLRNIPNQVEIMCCHKHGTTLFGKSANDAGYLGAEFRVEGARWFVQQQQGGVHCQRTRNRDSLLLTAGEFCGISICLVLQADSLEQLGGASRGIRARHFLDLHRRKHDVLDDAHVSKEIKVLKDHAHARSLGAQLFVRQNVQASVCANSISDQFTVHSNITPINDFEMVDTAQKSGLACA